MQSAGTRASLSSLSHSLASYRPTQPPEGLLAALETWLARLFGRWYSRRSAVAAAAFVVAAWALGPSLRPVWTPFPELFAGRFGSSENTDKDKMLRRKKKAGRYTVGLYNRANDCFANSNLQAFAALRGLYEYLDDAAAVIPSVEEDEKDDAKHVARLTQATLEMVRSLNEPVSVPKTISPWTLLAVVERIYNSRISRAQHDAHELLHLLLETLQTENERLRKRAPPGAVAPFVFDGATVDQIICSRCGYSPPAKPVSFLVLSLMVPQRKSATLGSLLDEQAAPEHINGYGCTMCRLRAAAEKDPQRFSPYLANPERLPDEIEAALPKDVVSSIAKSTKFWKLPPVLALHLSRSIFAGYGASRNSCKVQVPEVLELFEIGPQDGANDETPEAVHVPSPSQNTKEDQNTDQNTQDAPDTAHQTAAFGAAANALKRRRVRYELTALVRHKGTHSAGHYECFRRKNYVWWRKRVSGQDGTAPPAFSAPVTPRARSPVASSAASVSSATSSASHDPAPAPRTNGNHNGTHNGTHNGPSQPHRPTPQRPTARPTAAPRSFSHGSASSASSATSTATAPPQSNPISSTVSTEPSTATNGHHLPIPHLPYPNRSQPSPASVSATDIAPAVSITRAATPTSIHSAVGASTAALASHIVGPVGDISPYPWWKISDDKVTECSTKEVLKDEAGAYLLFYERVSDP